MKKGLLVAFLLLFAGSGEVIAETQTEDIEYLWYETDGPGEREFQFNNAVVAIGMPIGLWKDIGYAVPAVGTSFAASLRLSSRFALNASAHYYFRSIKRGPGDGTKSGGSVGAQYYLTERIFIGSFAAGGRQTTSRWKKDTLYVGGNIGAHFGDPNGDRMTLVSETSYDVKSFNHGVHTGFTMSWHIPIGKKSIGERTTRPEERHRYPGALINAVAVYKDTWGITANVGMGVLYFRQQRAGVWGREFGVVVDYYAGLYWNVW